MCEDWEVRYSDSRYTLEETDAVGRVYTMGHHNTKKYGGGQALPFIISTVP